MNTALTVLAALVLLFIAFRSYWLYSRRPRKYTVDFDGKLYRAGENYIAISEGDPDTDRSIICFPGFLEDIRYFMELYREEDCQLIFVNNAAYNFAVDSNDIQDLDWDKNPHKVGTIEYDGFHLGLIVQHLATGAQVVLHGHSRGGAVVLEAGRQYPEVMKAEGRYIRAILEAAVLPGGKTVGKGSEPVPFALICLFLPIVLGLQRNTSEAKFLQQPMMKPTTPRKTELCMGIYHHPMRYKTCVTNVRSIRNWQRTTDDAVYENYERLDIVIGERDDVLDNKSMMASAERAEVVNEGANILRTENTNHFVTLERPEYITGLL